MKKPEPNLFLRYQDKTWHFLLGMLVAFIVATFVKVWFWELPDFYWQGVALVFGFLGGLARELWNAGLLKWSPPKGTGFDWWDLAWTVAGSVFVITGLIWGWN